MEDCVLVSVSFPEDGNKDSGVLIVGRQTKNGHVDIINAFQGEEARELYKKITSRKYKGEV